MPLARDRLYQWQRIWLRHQRQRPPMLKALAVCKSSASAGRTSQTSLTHHIQVGDSCTIPEEKSLPEIFQKMIRHQFTKQGFPRLYQCLSPVFCVFRMSLCISAHISGHREGCWYWVFLLMYLTCWIWTGLEFGSFRSITSCCFNLQVACQSPTTPKRTLPHPMVSICRKIGRVACPVCHGLSLYRSMCSFAYSLTIAYMCTRVSMVQVWLQKHQPNNTAQFDNASRNSRTVGS